MDSLTFFVSFLSRIDILTFHSAKLLFKIKHSTLHLNDFSDAKCIDFKSRMLMKNSIIH
jgi:hypothetical protein